MNPAKNKLGPRVLSVLNEGKLFILHFSLIILVATATLFLIQSPGGNRVFNLDHRRPHFLGPEGEVVAGASAYRPLQCDITTALDIAGSVTGAAALWWSADLLWHCAFIFREKDKINEDEFAKVVSSSVMDWPSPSVLKKRKNIFLVYLLIFGSFMMDYLSSILTGSITWEPAFISVNDFGPVVNITEGLPGANISWYQNESVFVSDAIDFGAALALVPWGDPGTDTFNLPIPSNVIRRAIIQDTAVQTIQYLSVGSTLDTIRLPYFKVEKFEYIKNPAMTLTSRQKSLLNDSSVYNPYLLNRGFAAFLPDTAWGPGSSHTLPSPTTVSESRILGILVDRPATPSCTPFPESIIPPNVNSYLTSIANSTLRSCFVFANVTYTAGGAICRKCKIVSPALVQADINGENLQPVPDPLTIDALALTPAVGTQIWVSFLAHPAGNASTPFQDSAIESVSQAYQATWSSLVVELGGIGPNNQTGVAFAIPASRPFVLHWRVYIWAGLHVGVLLGGIVFVVWRGGFNWDGWDQNPVHEALQLARTGFNKKDEAASLKDLPQDHEGQPIEQA